MHTNRTSPHYSNIDGIGDPDKYSGHGSISGSLSGSLSGSGPHSPSPYFYDLQMYSNTNPSPPPPTSHSHPNLYQNAQEVHYHQGQVGNRRGASNNSNRVPAPINNLPGNRQQSSPVGSLRKVEAGGVTFIDPFAPSQYSSSPNSPPPQNCSNHYTSSNTPNSPAAAQKVHVSSETVLEPVYATFGTEPIFVTCPYCHHTESTEIEQVIGTDALLWACIIPCFGFLRKSKWDTRHSCQNCLNVIGTHYP